MGTSYFFNATIYWNGTLLSEHARGSIAVKTEGERRNYTTAKGFAGITPGWQHIIIEVESAEAAADFEMDPGAIQEALDGGDILVFVNGRTLTGKGDITEDNFSVALEHNHSLCFTFEGRDWSIS